MPGVTYAGYTDGNGILHSIYFLDMFRETDNAEAYIDTMLGTHSWEYLKLPDFKRVGSPCNSCGLKQSVSEALNSGSGVYKP